MNFHLSFYTSVCLILSIESSLEHDSPKQKAQQKNLVAYQRGFHAVDFPDLIVVLGCFQAKESINFTLVLLKNEKKK